MLQCRAEFTIFPAIWTFRAVLSTRARISLAIWRSQISKKACVNFFGIKVECNFSQTSCGNLRAVPPASSSSSRLLSSNAFLEMQSRLVGFFGRCQDRLWTTALVVLPGTSTTLDFKIFSARSFAFERRTFSLFPCFLPLWAQISYRPHFFICLISYFLAQDLLFHFFTAPLPPSSKKISFLTSVWLSTSTVPLLNSAFELAMLFTFYWM